MDEFTARKLAHNEALFREVNERIHDIRGHVAPDESSYICECVNAQCFDTIALSNTTYREIRVEPTHFVVVPGHELEDIERVVRRTDAYLIVEKVVPVPPVADPS